MLASFSMIFVIFSELILRSTFSSNLGSIGLHFGAASWVFFNHFAPFGSLLARFWLPFAPFLVISAHFCSTATLFTLFASFCSLLVYFSSLLASCFLSSSIFFFLFRATDSAQHPQPFALFWLTLARFRLHFCFLFYIFYYLLKLHRFH